MTTTLSAPPRLFGVRLPTSPNPAVPGVLLMTSVLLGTPAPTIWSTTPPAAVQEYVDSFVSGRIVSYLSTSTANTSRTIAERVESLRSTSGLTTDQVARLMGVSRRSVHNWLAGGPMTRANEERLSRLLEVTQGVAGTPSERRAELLDSSGGRSLFHRLLDEQVEWATIHSSPITPRERIGS